MAIYPDWDSLTDDEREIVEPIKIGPTWLRDENGKWLLPERTLGWEIAGWCAEWLVGNEGKPWKFTAEQLRFILWWYAVDEHGEFIYRTGVLQRLKGWGKDPLLAVICLVELVGPSRVQRDAFGLPMWRADGNPMGMAHPQAYVQVSAVNLSQTQNTMDLIPSLMTDAFIRHYGIKPGAELIRAHGGKQKLQAVTSNYRAIEGKRTTFSVLNETHHWVAGNGGHKMYETIDGNATKMNSRYLAITNAYLPGEDSVAERMRLAWEKLQEKIAEDPANDIGFLYDSLEAGPKAPISGPLVPFVLHNVRGDAVWLVIKGMMQSIANSTIGVARSRRMYYNQVMADEEALHGPETWDPLADDKLTLQPGDEITLGFDGSKSRDGTALIALRVRDAAAFVLGFWERPDGPEGEEWEVPRWEVDSYVHDAFRTYSVVAFFADVREWESYIADWAEAYAGGLKVRSSSKDGIGWDMRGQLKRSTMAHERLMRTIFDSKMKHDGDRRLRRHVLNAKRKVNIYGVYFGKDSPDSPRKIDAYAALMLAHEALTEYRTSGKKQSTRTGKVWFL